MQQIDQLIYYDIRKGCYYIISTRKKKNIIISEIIIIDRNISLNDP